MSKKKTYCLEYLVDKTRFSERGLKSNIDSVLEKYLPDLEYQIEANGTPYLILTIKSTEKIIDACYDKLEFEGEWAFRTKDELGNQLRSRAYPILADIELSLRIFINQALVDVIGFNWLDKVVPKGLRKKIKETESKSGKLQGKLHHPVEFMMFDDLIDMVTTNFQAWSDDYVLTASDLTGILSSCNTIQEFKSEIEKRRKRISLWDNVFANYFDNKEAWSQLKETIESKIIPIRNKVMHHRLMRIYELRQVSDCRNEIHIIIDSAKPKLSEIERQEAKNEFENIRENSSFIYGMQNILAKQISPGFLQAARDMATMQVNPKFLQAAREIATMQANPKFLQAMRDMATMQVNSKTLQAARDMATMQANPKFLQAMRDMAAFQVNPKYLQAMRDIATLHVDFDFLETNSSDESDNEDNIDIDNEKLNDNSH